jgi:hypothetical protein
MIYSEKVDSHSSAGSKDKDTPGISASPKITNSILDSTRIVIRA